MNDPAKSPASTRHFFLRDTQKFPIACIATHKPQTLNSIDYALSICNPLDFQNFSPDRARRIAEERLAYYMGKEKKVGDEISQVEVRYRDEFLRDGASEFDIHKVGTLTLEPGHNPKLHLLQHIAMTKAFPKRVREAAKFQVSTMLAKGRVVKQG